MKFAYKDSALVPDKELAGALEKLKGEAESMNKAASLGYEDERASVNLPLDKEMLEQVKALMREKIGLKPKYLIVVGIGGSNLGTMAVQEAVLGKTHNQLNEGVKILYADTVDSDLIDEIIRIVEPVLKKGENVLINGVSKSGGTTETIANFEVLVELVRKHREDYEKYVVATTNKGSKFWDLALEKGFSVLEVPEKVGGRYSVFSPVGLFPLGLLGMDIDALLRGAREMREKCLNTELPENPAAVSASLIYSHYRKGRNIYDLFLFSKDLVSIGKWYRQLMGESIGKEFNREGKKVSEGITPIISIGSTDLHSIAQLYLGGPDDKFTTFVTVEKNKSDVRLPKLPEYSQLVESIQGRPLKEIMDAIIQGVQTAFRNGKRPFTGISLQDKSEYSIGELLQFKMMEMMYLGALLEVNPFDQPNVESYKSETRKILAGGSR